MKSFLQRPLISSCPRKVKQHQSCIKIFSLLISILFLQANVKAQQYHTYHDADSANPILNATPKPQNITGLQFFDVDGDKDLDCYVMNSSHKLVLYTNVGTITRPEYQLSDVSGLEDITLPTTSFTQNFYFFDMDNDGDKDLFIEGQVTNNQHSDANYSYITTFLNDGSSQKPHFTTTTINPLYYLIQNQYRFYFFNFQDIDGDGDMDFAYTALATYATRLVSGVYLNTSTGGIASFSKIDYGTEFNPGFYPYPLYESFYDFSGDGLPDCLLYSGSGEIFFPNTGTKTSPHVNASNFYPGPKFSIAPVTCIVDLNNDGQVEVFNDHGNYETVTPVPVLKDTTVKIGGRSIVKLTATTQLPGYKYQWEYNGRKVPGYNKPFIYAPLKGKYVLYIKDSLGTGVSLPYIITSLKANSAFASREEITISTKIAAQALSVKVYPNPFKQNITLALTGGNQATPKIIRISDMAGKIWLTQTTGASTVQIGATLPKGLYQLEVWENNKLAYHTKILKQ